ncbi:MAG: Mbeg1-like protein [Oscillospiraceae bacterium]
MAASARFSQARLLCGYENKIDDETQTQFSALTLLLPDGTAYVAFRGTDDTIVGWKEDFNLAFLPVVPAQRMAVQTTCSRRRRRFSARPLRVGGHSKGGNLAVYSRGLLLRSRAEPARAGLQQRRSRLPAPRCCPCRSTSAVAGRIITILPESSVVGILLEHEERVSRSCAARRSASCSTTAFRGRCCGERFEHLTGPDRGRQNRGPDAARPFMRRATGCRSARPSSMPCSTS